jgi:hypothetical protein
MAENLDAEQYQQALRLVLGELEDLDTAHPVDIGYRLGELKVHLRTLIGDSGRPPGHNNPPVGRLELWPAS